MTDENQLAFYIKEGWLNVWEVLCCMDGYGAGRMKEDKHQGPSWEPHFCLLNVTTKKLLHFRSEKAAVEYISRLRDDFSPSEGPSIYKERIGPSREHFYRKNNPNKSAPPLSDFLMVADSTSDRISDPIPNSSASQSHFSKLGNFQKSQTLDNRATPSQLLAGMNEAGSDKIYSHSTSVVDKRRGSGSSLCSDESSSKQGHQQQQQQHQNQSKLANFFSRKSQQLKSNLKRTKSATKLDRKKTNGDSDGPPSVYEPEGPSSPRTSSNVQTIKTSIAEDQDLPDYLKRSASTGRLSKRRVVKPQKVQAMKTMSEASERVSSCMRTSHSHEALLTSPSEVHNSLDLSHPDVMVRPVHSSIWSVEYCFMVSRKGHPLLSSSSEGRSQDTTDTLGIPPRLGFDSGITKYYKCGSDADMHKWISSIKNCMRSNRDSTFRKDNSLQLSIVESKNLPPKKKYYCELYLDEILYARTSAKLMQDHVFWGEQFNFGELPNVQTISIHLFRDADRKKKRERPFKIGSIDIPSGEFKNTPMMCEKWFEVHSSSASRKGTRDSRVEGVGIRIKGRYLSVDVLPLCYYKPLAEFVQNDYSALVELLEPVISVKSKEGLATCLASSLHCAGHVITFLCDIVMAEVDRLENNALALRGNSIATKAVEAYMKIVGQKYLVSTLKDVLKAVIDSGIDCEVDPGRLSTSSSLTSNRHALVTHCTLVWYKIINSSIFFPSELKKLFQMIRLSCESRPNISVSVCRQLISSCIFLRFFCPAILSPNLFSIIQEFPCDRGVRNLTLIAKTIQSLANLTLFGGKEKFMDFMNSFVSHEIANMQAYLDNISTFSDDEEQRSCDPVIDQSRELALLHSILVESFKSVSEEGKSKFSGLSDILHNISSAQLNQQHRNADSIDSSAIPIDDLMISNSKGRLPSSTVPPFTPTTVVHPASPVKILQAECTDFPTNPAYVSTISRTLLKGTNAGHNRPLMAAEEHHRLQESEVLNPSVRRAAVPLDEQQIESDWKKIIEAAIQSSEGNGSISLVDFGTTNSGIPGSHNFSRSSPVINSCKAPRRGPQLELPAPLLFNNPTFSRNPLHQHHHHHHPPSHPRSNKKASKHSSKNPVFSSHDNLKMPRNTNGASRTGVLLSRVSDLRTGDVSGSSHYRSNSSDSIVNCKDVKPDRPQKTLASPLSSSTPRIDKSSHSSSEAKKMWSQASSSHGPSSRTSAISKSFDETLKPVDSGSVPHSSSSSASEHVFSKVPRQHGMVSTDLKNSKDALRSPRRQTVHYDVSPVSTLASPDPCFGTLPLQSLKGHQMHNSSSTPRLQASSNLSTSSQSQPSGQIDFAFSSSPSKKFPTTTTTTEVHSDAKQQRLQRDRAAPSHPSSSPSLASSSPTATPLAESQQVASTRSSSIQSALHRQRHQNRHQQWNSVLECDRHLDVMGTKLNANIVGSPRESEHFGRLSMRPVDFNRSFSCSQPRPSSSSSSSTGRGAMDLRPIDPTSPTSMNHARRLEFFNSTMCGGNSREEHSFGFEKRDSSYRSSAFGRFDSNRQRNEVIAFSSPSSIISQISHIKTPSVGRSTPSSFISLTNQNKRTSKAEAMQAKQMISSTNQQQSMLVYNVENNASEPIICKSTSC